MQNLFLKIRFRTVPVSLLAATMLATLAACPLALADDPKPEEKVAEPKPKKWDSVATVGVTLTRGNSKNFLASASVGTKRTWTNDEALFGANAGYGENTTTVNGAKVDST